MTDLNDTRSSESGGQQYAATLQELRAAIAEADRRINRLMVVRRRQLAAARLRQSAK